MAEEGVRGRDEAGVRRRPRARANGVGRPGGSGCRTKWRSSPSRSSSTSSARWPVTTQTGSHPPASSASGSRSRPAVDRQDRLRPPLGDRAQAPAFPGRHHDRFHYREQRANEKRPRKRAPAKAPGAGAAGRGAARAVPAALPPAAAEAGPNRARPSVSTSAANRRRGPVATSSLSSARALAARPPAGRPENRRAPACRRRPGGAGRCVRYRLRRRPASRGRERARAPRSTSARDRRPGPRRRPARRSGLCRLASGGVRRQRLASRGAELEPKQPSRSQDRACRENSGRSGRVELVRGGRVRARERAAARRGVEREPAVAVEPDLDPRVRVAVVDRPLLPLLVVGAAREAGGDPCGDPEVAEHERHRARRSAGSSRASSSSRNGRAAESRRPAAGCSS